MLKSKRNRIMKKTIAFLYCSKIKDKLIQNDNSKKILATKKLVYLLHKTFKNQYEKQAGM